MLYNLIITALLIVSFFMCIVSYWTGFKHGKRYKRDNIIPNVISPLSEAVRMVAKDKKPNELDTAMDELFNYSADVALDAIKKERR
jgi:threonine synthase